MRALTVSASAHEAPHEFRFDERCCFLKICAPRTPEAFSAELVNGVYIPLVYWDLLEASGPSDATSAAVLRALLIPPLPRRSAGVNDSP